MVNQIFKASILMLTYVFLISVMACKKSGDTPQDSLPQKDFMKLEDSSLEYVYADGEVFGFVATAGLTNPANGFLEIPVSTKLKGRPDLYIEFQGNAMQTSGSFEVTTCIYVINDTLYNIDMNSRDADRVFNVTSTNPTVWEGNFVIAVTDTTMRKKKLTGTFAVVY